LNPIRQCRTRSNADLLIFVAVFWRSLLAWDKTISKIQAPFSQDTFRPLAFDRMVQNWTFRTTHKRLFHLFVIRRTIFCFSSV
jgi:hypothetical protein